MASEIIDVVILAPGLQNGRASWSVLEGGFDRGRALEWQEQWNKVGGRFFKLEGAVVRLRVQTEAMDTTCALPRFNEALVRSMLTVVDPLPVDVAIGIGVQPMLRVQAPMGLGALDARHNGQRMCGDLIAFNLRISTRQNRCGSFGPEDTALSSVEHDLFTAWGCSLRSPLDLATAVRTCRVQSQQVTMSVCVPGTGMVSFDAEITNLVNLNTWGNGHGAAAFKLSNAEFFVRYTSTRRWLEITHADHTVEIRLDVRDGQSSFLSQLRPTPEMLLMGKTSAAATVKKTSSQLFLTSTEMRMVSLETTLVCANNHIGESVDIRTVLDTSSTFFTRTNCTNVPMVVCTREGCGRPVFPMIRLRVELSFTGASRAINVEDGTESVAPTSMQCTTYPLSCAVSRDCSQSLLFRAWNAAPTLDVAETTHATQTQGQELYRRVSSLVARKSLVGLRLNLPTFAPTSERASTQHDAMLLKHRDSGAWLRTPSLMQRTVMFIAPLRDV
jgi:hypothetical protein